MRVEKLEIKTPQIARIVSRRRNQTVKKVMA